MAKRKYLLIGGTGTISSAITRRMAADPDWDLYLLNRGKHAMDLPENVTVIKGDITNEAEVEKLLEGMTFDCVSQFFGFTTEQIEKDIRLFAGRTKQYIFTSSAAAYNKPPCRPYITEGMLLQNGNWEYARNKIACEELLYKAFREQGFPITIVRPSHTYSERMIPFCFQSPKGSWPVIKRMIEGKPIIVPGDGTSLWTITFNEDFAKGYCGLVGNLHAIGEAVHITTDEVLTWEQMGKAVADELGVEYKTYHIPTDVITALAPKFGEGLAWDKHHSVIFDNSKIKALSPGYTATVNWSTGVHRAIEYILQHPECRPEDPAFDEWCDKVIEIYDEALSKAKKTCMFLS